MTDVSEPLTGSHIQLRQFGTLPDAIRAIYQFQGNAIQFFLSAPFNGTGPRILSKDEIRETNRLKQEFGIYTVVHGKYIINFCNPKSVAMIETFAKELDMADAINTDVVLHQGKNISNVDRHEAQQAFVDRLVQTLKQTKGRNKILLENSAHQGTEIGYTVEELGEIYHRIPDDYKARIGFCIDLCHAFVAGALDVRDPDAVDTFFGDFDKNIGIEKLDLIHFNDSSVPFGGCNDQHRELGMGFIGNKLLGGSMEGFKRVARFASSRGIPMILESHGNAKFEIQMLRALALGEEDSFYDAYITTNHKYCEESALELSGKGKKKRTKKSESATTPPIEKVKKTIIRRRKV